MSRKITRQRSAVAANSSADRLQGAGPEAQLASTTRGWEGSEKLADLLDAKWGARWGRRDV